jgi:hypothetical protein
LFAEVLPLLPLGTFDLTYFFVFTVQLTTQTSMQPAGLFFVFSCTLFLYFIHIWFVFIVLHFVLLFLLTTTQTSMHPAVFEPAIAASERPACSAVPQQTALPSLCANVKILTAFILFPRL